MTFEWDPDGRRVEVDNRDVVNPKDRLGIKKAPIHLIPPVALIHEAWAMCDGARKYGPYNWRENTVIASIYVAACMRHLLSWFDREEVALDSGRHHLAHARANLGILLDALEIGNLKDDRPAPGTAARLIAETEEK